MQRGIVKSVSNDSQDKHSLKISKSIHRCAPRAMSRKWRQIRNEDQLFTGGARGFAHLYWEFFSVGT